MTLEQKLKSAVYAVQYQKKGGRCVWHNLSVSMKDKEALRSHVNENESELFEGLNMLVWRIITKY